MQEFLISDQLNVNVHVLWLLGMQCQLFTLKVSCAIGQDVICDGYFLWGVIKQLAQRFCLRKKNLVASRNIWWKVLGTYSVHVYRTLRNFSCVQIFIYHLQ